MKASLRFLPFAVLALATLFTACTTEDDDNRPLAVEMPISWKARQLDADNGATSFFAPTNGTSYRATDSLNFVANKVDISLAITDSARLVSLSVRRVNNIKPVIRVSRATSFLRTDKTKADFDTVTNKGIRGLTVPAGKNIIPVLQGIVYAFTTADTRRGWLYVTALKNSASGQANGAMTFDVKYEK